MRRFACVLALMGAFLVGCRSIGRFPEIDPTDYAYSYFKGKATQVYQFTPPQVEGSAAQAMGDLGFKEIEAERCEDVLKITAKTLDHRPVKITIRPRNSMTLFTVRIGVEGDEQVSKALIERIAENFGSAPRVVIPIESALAKRLDPPWPKPATAPAEESLGPPLPPETPGPFAPPAEKPVARAPKVDRSPWFRLVKWLTQDEDETDADED